MIDRAALRDAIIDALKATPAFDSYWIDKFSDDADAWKEKYLQAESGSMIVSYAGTTRQAGFEATPGRASAIHVVLFERSEDAGLAALKAAEQALHGLRLTIDGEALRCIFTRDNFVGEIDLYYQYEMQIRCELL